MTTPVFRTPLDGCFRQVSTAYGRYLAKSRDPLCDGELPAGALKTFELHADPPRIPELLWNAWVKLCFHLVEKDNGVEVGCRILRCISKPSEWRILIPDQSVTGASVHSEGFDHSIDLITGETIPSYPPEDWQPMGTSHSHNTMESFFSATDDSTELGDPGLHIVVGSIDLDKNTYTLKASITASRRRFIIDHNMVVTMGLTPSAFHKNVLANIRDEPLRPYGRSPQWWNSTGHRTYWDSFGRDEENRYDWTKRKAAWRSLLPGGASDEKPAEGFTDEEEFDVIEKRITNALNELCAVDRACEDLEARQAFLLLLENFVEELTGMEAAGTFDAARKPEDQQALEMSL